MSHVSLELYSSADSSSDSQCSLVTWIFVSFLFSLSVNAEDPPMIVVRKFVHLLDQSDQDFQEELDLMKMREEVITLIRSNQQLENDLNLMDIKIGLLVKNKITLQVWPGTCSQHGRSVLLQGLPPSS